MALIIVALCAVGVGIQQYMLGVSFSSQNGLVTYTHYNNYIIFKNAFDHLLEGKDLYTSYYSEQYDLFKYSPAFALCFGPFRFLPDAVGLVLWNLLNAIPLWLAFNALKIGDQRTRALVFIAVLVELITSMQNSQSNGLMAALMVLSFNSMQKDKMFLAALFIAFAVYIKLFAVVFVLLALLYSGRWRFTIYFILSCAALTIVPLVATPWSVLVEQYTSWWGLIIQDHGSSVGISVMGWLQTWFGFAPNKNWILSLGAALLLLPLIRTKEWSKDRFRMLYLSSCLIWVVIFNHKAESPTFVIAASGVCIWFLLSSKQWIEKVLFGLFVIFTVLIMTDIFPDSFISGFVEPYVIKGVPCILIWGYLLFEQMKGAPKHIVPV